MAYRVLLLALGLVFVASLASAASSKMGTAGAQELRIPVGSRGTAMGGAIIADVAGSEALFWNPAGVARIGGTQAFLSYRGYFADMTVSYFGLTSEFSYGTIGVSAKILSLGDIYVTTERDWDGTGEVYSLNIPVLGITYSRALTDRVAFGATGMYISEEVMQTSARGVAFDFGFQYVPGWRTLKVGMTMKNYGPRMQFSGPNFETSTSVPGDDPEAANRILALSSAAYELPSSFQLGLSYDFETGESSKMTVAGTFQSNNFSEDEFRFGVEYNAGGKFYLRGGYVYCDQDEYLYGPSFGVGAVFNVGGSKALLEYSHSFVNSYFEDIREASLSFRM